MPHLKVVKYDQNISLPKKVNNNIKFLFFAYGSYDTLLFCKIDSRVIYLRIKSINKGFLVKCEKGLEVTSFEKALILVEFKNFFSAEVFFTNVKVKDVNHEFKDKVFKSMYDFSLHDIKNDTINLEIGFGSGRHLLYQCNKNRNNFYIGLEVHKNSIEQVIKQSKLQKLTNLNVFSYDARLFLTTLSSNSITNIYLFFPVPWDESPNKRVINERFIREVLRVLKANGLFHLRTDSKNYLNYTKETLDNMDINYTERKNIPLDISSKYEDRWIKMGKDIYDILLHSTNTPKVEKIDNNFDFINIDLKKLKKIVGKKYIYNDGFFIIDSIYQTNQGYIFPIKLGSFFGNETLFLLYEQKVLSYFPHKPISTDVNAYIHDKIKIEIGNE